MADEHQRAIAAGLHAAAAHIRRSHHQRAAAGAAAVPTVAVPQANMGLALLPGSRVLDTVTGETGVVTDGRIKRVPATNS